MSIIFEANNCSLIDHSVYISKLYEKFVGEDAEYNYKLKSTIFCIKNVKKKNRKRKLDYDKIGTEAITLKNKYTLFKDKIPDNIKKKLYSQYNVGDTKIVRQFSQKLFEATDLNLLGINGGNNSNIPLKCRLFDNDFYLPGNSRFYCGDVKDICVKLDCNKYDIVIADPPWWNKYIRRLKSSNNKLSYTMMYNEDIGNLPIKNLLSSNCLVVIWCTNSPSCIKSVIDEIFPKWGVEYLTTWYWLKVCIDLTPICEFSSGCMKQPYERLIIGKVGNIGQVPEEKIIVSVPSALHSHKPPIIELLQAYLSTKNACVLELFARYLLPNTTSIGFEPLKWQHSSLFELEETVNIKPLEIV
ncbi:hypothetical protein ACJJTC_007186 [Scirpophaga incertulas]